MKFRAGLLGLLLFVGCSDPTSTDTVFSLRHSGVVSTYNDLLDVLLPNSAYDGVFTNAMYKSQYLSGDSVRTFVAFSSSALFLNKLGDPVPDSGLHVTANDSLLSPTPDEPTLSSSGQQPFPGTVTWKLDGDAYYPGFQISFLTVPEIRLLDLNLADSLDATQPWTLHFDAGALTAIKVEVLYTGYLHLPGDTSATQNRWLSEIRKSAPNVGAVSIPAAPEYVFMNGVLRPFTPDAADVNVSGDYFKTNVVGGRTYAFVSGSVAVATIPIIKRN